MRPAVNMNGAAVKRAVTWSLDKHQHAGKTRLSSGTPTYVPPLALRSIVDSSMESAASADFVSVTSMAEPIDN